MKLYIKLVGTINIKVNNISIDNNLSEKAKGILFFLAMNNKDYHRNQLKNLFWSNFEESSANRNLRHAIWNIRNEVRKIDDSIELIKNVSKSIIKLNDRVSIKLDVKKFYNDYKIENFNEKDIRGLMKDFNGEFLENFYIHDAQEFNNWIYLEREKFKHYFFNFLYESSNLLIKNEKYDLSLEVLNNLLLIDTYNEELYLLIMKVHIQKGNKHFAINTYKEAKRVLREELNLGLSKEINDYYKKINLKKNIYNTKQIKKESINIDFKKWLNTNKVFKILLTNNKDLINSFRNVFIKNNKKNKIIELTKVPGRRLPYEGVFEFLDEYSYRFNSNNFRLSKIMDMKTKQINELLLFNEIKLFLNENKIDKTINVIIYNLSHIDDKTIDFISYLYRSNCLEKFKFLIAYNKNWERNRIKFFIEAIEDEDNVEIVENN